MKISTVFIVSFIALTSANDSYQQCGVEHTKINQLEMQIQQLKNNNQVCHDVIISSKTKYNNVNNKKNLSARDAMLFFKIHSQHLCTTWKYNFHFHFSFTFQALAASGGVSAVNMLVGFLSGYAGSHSNNNNKCCNNLDAVREAVRALQESNAELVAKVKIVEQQMSNVTTSGVSRLE